MRLAAGQIYDRALRPILFRMDPERAHHIGQSLLRREWPWSLLATDMQTDRRLEVTVAPWKLPSPIGLAAGFDKNGYCVPGLQHLGFEFINVGSILNLPSPGHPRPRLVRRPETESLINCYGLPSDGIDRCAEQFKHLATQPRRSKLIANLHSESPSGYYESITKLAPYSDGVELALRCPNIAEHQNILPRSDLAELLAPLRDRWPTLPVFLKLPPFFDDAEQDNRLELIDQAIGFGITGVTIPGTSNVPDDRLSRKSGSLSGRATFTRNLNAVKAIAGVGRGRIAIKASGGVHTGQEALAVLQAGATMIDIFTAFIYRGWDTAFKIKTELLRAMDDAGVATLNDLTMQRASTHSGDQ